MRRIIIATLLLSSPHLAQAACTQAEARAKMDTLNTLMATPGRRTPADNDRIMAGTMEVMRPGTVTEQTCTQLDSLIAQARR